MDHRAEEMSSPLRTQVIDLYQFLLENYSQRRKC